MSVPFKVHPDQFPLPHTGAILFLWFAALPAEEQQDFITRAISLPGNVLHEQYRNVIASLRERWKNTHRRPHEKTSCTVEEIIQFRRQGWSWQKINKRYGKEPETKWAQNTLKNHGYWPCPRGGNLKDSPGER